MSTASLSIGVIFQSAKVTSEMAKSFIPSIVAALSITPVSRTSMYSGATSLPKASASFLRNVSHAAFSFAMMSASEGGAVVFVSADLFAFAFAFAIVSLLPAGCVAQAAARISRDTNARIFFILKLLGFMVCCQCFYVKNLVASREKQTRDLRKLIYFTARLGWCWLFRRRGCACGGNFGNRRSLRRGSFRRCRCCGCGRLRERRRAPR